MEIWGVGLQLNKTTAHRCTQQPHLPGFPSESRPSGQHMGHRMSQLEEKGKSQTNKNTTQITKDERNLDNKGNGPPCELVHSSSDVFFFLFVSLFYLFVGQPFSILFPSFLIDVLYCCCFCSVCLRDHCNSHKWLRLWL